MSLFRIRNVSQIRFSPSVSVHLSPLKLSFNRAAGDRLFLFIIFFTAVKLDSRWVNTAFSPDSGHSVSMKESVNLDSGIMHYDWIVWIPVLIDSSLETHRQRSSFGCTKTEELLSCLSSHTRVQWSKFNVVFCSLVHLSIQTVGWIAHGNKAASKLHLMADNRPTNIVLILTKPLYSLLHDDKLKIKKTHGKSTPTSKSDMTQIRGGTRDCLTWSQTHFGSLSKRSFTRLSNKHQLNSFALSTWAFVTRMHSVVRWNIDAVCLPRAAAASKQRDWSRDAKKLLGAEEKRGWTPFDKNSRVWSSQQRCRKV